MKRTLAFILALGLIFAPIAFAGNQETEVSAGGYLTSTLANLLNTTQTLVNELAADANANRLVLGNWEALLEEVAADLDAMKVTLGNWDTQISTNTGLTLPDMPAALSANVTPASVATTLTADSTLGSGTELDPSISLTI